MAVPADDGPAGVRGRPGRVPDQHGVHRRQRRSRGRCAGASQRQGGQGQDQQAQRVPRPGRWLFVPHHIDPDAWNKLTADVKHSIQVIGGGLAARSPAGVGASGHQGCAAGSAHILGENARDFLEPQRITVTGKTVLDRASTRASNCVAATRRSAATARSSAAWPTSGPRSDPMATEYLMLEVAGRECASRTPTRCSSPRSGSPSSGSSSTTWRWPMRRLSICVSGRR